MKKRILSSGFFLILSFLTILAFLSILPASTSFAIQPDDEKEEFRDCPDGQTIQIFCTEGKIDCTPKDC